MSDYKIKLGSLFDGIGGFPLAAQQYGIEPVWASEIDKSCIQITKKHFPEMKHLGDITKIHGDEIEPVDIITGGSPCQDFSIAGKQIGIKKQCEICGNITDFEENICPDCGGSLSVTRSSLFMEQIRIIKEMRIKTNERYPKIIVWENVPRAFGSNNGEDFFYILREFCNIKYEKLSLFRPEKWSGAGEILGDGFSVAWRVLDAQYWGVPQRRRRIYLVADLAGERAGKILFESEGVPGYPEQSRSPWQRTSSGIGKSTEKPSWGRIKNYRYTACFHYQQGGCMNTFPYEENISPTILRNQKMAVLIRNNDSEIVRRLTPLECERLQGFPDNWTDSVSDSVRYKVLGNSIALPCVDYIMSGIVNVLKSES